MTTKPHKDTALVKFLDRRILEMKPKTQSEMAFEAGFKNANVLSMIRSGSAKLPLDRVPALAKAIDCDPAHLLRLALDQTVGSTSAAAIVEILGSPVTVNERGWLDEIRDASQGGDPRVTTRSRTTLRNLRQVSARKTFAGFVVPQDGPLTKAEKGWVELLRVICFDGVPTPSLPVVQVLREALDAQRRYSSPR